ncbi:hypothetical protein PBAL39_13275 [Pedobacter sp. BAL39]|uniref:hypothetical protein n=1 Tax=Pedobacter sp. BAL39 TaxID=391596 RepID=UPI0001559776|nr:hypothetical protein [Pedobacter sp. BAL39]EDM35443.1 hypothetical protein PBAL39_13275 [Pedobacter sp. BAL39]
MFSVHSQHRSLWRQITAAVIVLSSIVYYGCSKHSGSPQGQLAENEKPQQLLPAKIEVAGTSTSLSYQGNSPRIEEIKRSDGYRQKISYSAEGIMLMLEKLRSDVLYEYLEYYPDQKGVIEGAQKFVLDTRTNSFIADNSYAFSYDDQHRLHTIATYNRLNTLINNEERGYSESGNLVEISQKPSSGPALKKTYTFDEKQGCFKNVSYADLLAMETDLDLMTSRFNNRLSSVTINTSTSTVSYSYQYNNAGYPIAITEKGASTKSFKISYG